MCITRAATPFERLRAAVDRYAAARQNAPAGFSLQHGHMRDYKARADFSRGFFAAGGYEVISPAGFATPDAAARGFCRVGGAASRSFARPTRITPRWCRPWCRRIRARQPAARHRPGRISARTRSRRTKRPGVDEFIHVRADAVELLTDFTTNLELNDENIS